MPGSSKGTKSKPGTTKHGKQKAAATAAKSASSSVKKRGRAESQSESSRAAKKTKGTVPFAEPRVTRGKAKKTQQSRAPGCSVGPIQAGRKGGSSDPSAEVEQDSEEFDGKQSESSLDGGDEQPGIDEEDYDDVDLDDPFERASWGQHDSGSTSTKAHTGSDHMEIDSDDQEKPRRKFLSHSQKQRQAAEQPVWTSTHHRTSSTVSSSRSKSYSLGGNPSDSDTDKRRDEYNGDPDSIELIIPQGSRYPTLTTQPPRVASVIRKAFVVSEQRIAFENPYPPLAEFDRFFRGILRDAARELGDNEIALEVKTNASYGNMLAHLVKPRFTRYRREIRDYAKAEARVIYRLQSGREDRVKALLLDDTFVYGIDERGNAINSEPYQHPAIVSMIRFFFADSRSIGQIRAESFESSIAEEQHEARSQEKEVPIAMVAFSAAMLRAELLLWTSGNRSNIVFDADSHSGAYDHHVEALEQLKSNFPVRFHRLMHFLYTRGSASTSSSASRGWEGKGVLGRLDWQEDSE